MKILFKLIAVISLSILFLSAVQAKIELHEFKDTQQQLLYKQLSEQLRCLVCQNQNLADSNAELAQDMRKKTYEMVVENKSKDEIVDYWVSRYGDFVLYKPPFKMNTLLLWAGPFVLLLAALFIGFRLVQKSRRENTADEVQNIDHQQAKKLLEQDE